LVIFSPDPRQRSPHSGRKSTYPTVQIPQASSDGKRGLALFLSERPDLVITDIIMPEMEGLQTITEIRRSGSAVKVIAMSGGCRLFNRDFLEIARLLGASDVIAKPFDSDDFLCRVGDCLVA
jgi:YesN/AraC family two-component response regulator